MCMSVPQIAVRCTLMSTSLWPTVGSGTSCSQMPGSARALTNAFMKCPVLLGGAGFVHMQRNEELPNNAQIAPCATEGLNNPINLLAGVCSTHLGANSCLSMGHDREGEGHHIG